MTSSHNFRYGQPATSYWVDIADGLNGTQKKLLMGGTISAWGDEYCYIAYCIHPGQYPSAHALFPPSADALFHQSIIGYSFPRAAVGGGSFWHYTEDLKAQAEEFAYTVDAVTARLISRNVPSCPSECHCDAATRCGKPYVPTGEGTGDADEKDAKPVLSLPELLSLRDTGTTSTNANTNASTNANANANMATGGGCMPQFAPMPGFQCAGGDGSQVLHETMHSSGDCCAYCSANADPYLLGCTAWSYATTTATCTVTLGQTRGTKPTPNANAVCGYLVNVPAAPAWLDTAVYEYESDTRESVLHEKMGAYSETHKCTYPNATHAARDTFGAHCESIAPSAPFEVHSDRSAYCLTCNGTPNGDPTANAIGTFCARDGSRYMRVVYADSECKAALPRAEQNGSAACRTVDSNKPCGEDLRLQLSETCTVGRMCAAKEPPVTKACHSGFGGQCDRSTPPCTGDSCHEVQLGGRESISASNQRIWFQRLAVV